MLIIALLIGLYHTYTNDQKNGSNSLYRVTDVIDGDTIKISINGQEKTVRLIGIDSPETKHPTKPEGCYGQESSEFLTKLILDREISLEKDISETDLYGRLLRYVWIDEKLINEELVKEGFTVARSYPPDVKYQDLLRDAERFARENELGLWNGSNCP